MQRSHSTLALVTLAATAMLGSYQAVADEGQWAYDPRPDLPYGAPNPAQTDPEARIFDRFIGSYTCDDRRTSYPAKETTEATGTWLWQYDMNGYAIRDQYRAGKAAPVSQRFYNAKTKQWHVWYFLGQSFYYGGEWLGGAEGDRLVFKRTDTNAEGRNIISRLEYFDITPNSFSWQSSNIDADTGETFVDWEIKCQRQ